MSRIYDNWERLVAAALKKEQLWQLCHAQSRSPSVSSESSGFSFGLGLTSSVDDVPFTTPNPASDQKEDDDIHGVKTASAIPSSEKGTMCAMKEYNLHSDSSKSKQVPRLFGKEIALLSSLKHPNIVPYYGAETVGDILYVYYEYVSGGSICTILQEYGKLGESAIRSYTQQILAGLAYLHSKSITHGDIRGHTILVDPTGGVKLSNFGIEKQIARQFHPSLLMESPYWMAPEVMMNPNARNNAIDIWSLGCTVIEMATSKPRFSQCDVGVAIFKVSNHRELPSIPDHLSDDGKDFLRRFLQWNPMYRATASQLLEHPFVKSSSPLGKTIRGSDRGLASSSFTAPKSNFQPSDIYTPRNISTRVLVGSPLPLPRLPQHLQTQISSPSESNLRSTPLIGGNGVIQYLYLNQPLSPLETFRNLSVNSSAPFNGPSYLDPNILGGINDSHRKQFVKASNGQISS